MPYKRHIQMQHNATTIVYLSKRGFIRGIITYFLHSHNYKHLFEFLNDSILVRENKYLAHTCTVFEVSIHS